MGIQNKMCSVGNTYIETAVCIAKAVATMLIPMTMNIPVV
jgi:hypothetical protein